MIHRLNTARLPISLAVEDQIWDPVLPLAGSDHGVAPVAGVLLGVAPERGAARMDPAVTLRHELP